MIPNPVFSQNIIRNILPSETDSTITEYNQFHQVVINPNASSISQLLIFYPGTGGPGFGYKDILEVAADLGYHAIGLTYQNPEPINTLCAASTDPECFSKARTEVFNGDSLSDIITVERKNSIESRLIHLIEYLEINYPEEAWGQFLQGNSINWESTVLAGHSQGGGHAGYQAFALFEVEKVFFIGSLDGNINGFAPWITSDTGKTNHDRYYSLAHKGDELISYAIMQQAWSAMGISQYGILDVDIRTPNPIMDSVRCLATSITPAPGGTNHGAIAATNATPKDIEGVPTLYDVWRYALYPEQSILSTKDVIEAELFEIKGNTIFLSTEGTLEYFNLQGQLIERVQKQSGTSLLPKFSNLQMYIIRFQDHNGNVKSQTIQQ